jgi:hypothetical protein
LAVQGWGEMDKVKECVRVVEDKDTEVQAAAHKEFRM